MDQILTELPLDVEKQQEIRSLQRAYLNESLKVAFLGRFSAGKSTLINALFNRPGLLPTRTTVTTALLTEIRAGQEDKAVLVRKGVELELAIDAIKEYTQDTEQIADIDLVSITLKNTLLSQGVVLLDTPGENSLHDRHYEEAHRAIAGCDAAVFVMDKASLTQANLLYLQTIQQFQPNLIFVLNQIDRLVQEGEGEQLVDIISRLEEELSSALGMDAMVHALSAKEGTGVDIFRSQLFEKLVSEVEHFKSSTAALRLQRLLTEASSIYTQEESLLKAALTDGSEGVERQKVLLDRERTQTMKIVEKEKQSLLGERQQLRTKLKSDLQQLGARMKQAATEVTGQVKDRESSQTAGLAMQQKVLQEKSRFTAEALQEIKERCTKGFELQLAEIEQSAGTLRIPAPDLSELESRQQQRMTALHGDLEQLKQRYEAVAGQIGTAEPDAGVKEELYGIEVEVERIKLQLDASYVPVYVEREVGDPNAFKKLGKDVGKLIDFAIMFVPVAGQTTTAKKLATEGVKGVTKEVLKKSTKEMIKHSAKDLLRTGPIIKSAVPSNPMLDILNLASFEGIGEKIGSSLDEAYRSSRIEMVEDEEQRKTFYQQKQQLELEYLQKQRSLKQAKGAIQDQKQTELRQAAEKAQLENLLREKECALQQLEDKLQVERKEESVRLLRTGTQEVMLGFLDKELALMDAWVEAQLLITQRAISEGLEEYYSEQFQMLDEKMQQLLERAQAETDTLQRKLAEVQGAIVRCGQLKEALALGESVGMAG
ncbi:dynamin family protein [Fontibacillus panacisegetis]|uniref:dynamin family protein n=1 Tax=Fontibacillus solani TaxID=1572857 RepID=UPI001FEC0200|nr:dynamin family protein [Fontibacillus solani]